MAACADPGRFIHQPVACGTAGREGGIEIGHPVADMMDARSAPLQELRDRAVGGAGLEQFDIRLAEGERDDAGTVGFLGVPGDEAEDVCIERQRGFNALHRDADVGDTGLVGHGRWVSGGRRRILRRGGVRVLLKISGKDQERMASANVVNVTDKDFATQIEQAKGLSIVDFWAVWCGPCQAIAPVIDQLADQYAGKIKVAKLDTDTNQNTAVRFNVRSIPTIMLFKDGKHVDTIIGADPRIKTILEGKIQQHMG